MLPSLPILKSATFVALDFETADYEPDSACAIGLVRVEKMCIVRREVLLLRPPRPHIVFSYLHGITWAMVETAPTFATAWPELVPVLEDVDFVAAHNAGFDRRVLTACCTAAALPLPPQPFVCTVQLARRSWGHRHNDLASVCRRLGIALNHHDALSDAEACARIVIAAAGGDHFPVHSSTASTGR